MTNQAQPDPKQPEELVISKLERARNIARHLMTAVEQLPESSDRTSAHARAEEALNYIQKLVDEEGK